MTIQLDRPVIMIGPQEFDYKKVKPKEHSTIIWVDGGLNHKPFIANLEQHQHISIGDGDSAKKHLISPEHKLPKEKDFSDLTYGLSLLKSYQNQIESWGFFGGRLDHQLANLGEVSNYLYTKNQQSFLWDNTALSLSPGQYQFNRTGLFSLISFSDIHVQLLGDIRYPIKEVSKLSPCRSFGISNQSMGAFSLTIQGGACLLLWGSVDE